MKVLIKEETKVVKTQVYVSADGKEFANEADCKSWESSYEGVLEATWKTTPKKKVSGPSFGIPSSSWDDECYVVKPKTLDEVVFLNAYIGLVQGYASQLSMNEVNKTLLINFGYDRDYCEVYVLEKHLTDLIEQVRDAIDNFVPDEEEN